MKRRLTRFALGAALAALALAGCEKDDFDHNPPAGMGTLYVVNRTGDDLDVFINGQQATNGVSGWDDTYYDMAPGVPRVVVDDTDFERSWGGDVDVLNGRRTIMEVRPDPGNIDVLDVFIWFDD